jgi:hypothetical protein
MRRTVGPLVLTALVSCLLFVIATPAFASAKATSYLPGGVSANAVTSRATATLTYMKSGHKVGVSRQYVSLYRYDSRKRKWVYRSKTKTDSAGRFTFAFPSGYRYRLYYAGDRSRKPVWSATLKLTLVPAVTFLEVLDSSYLEDGVTTAVSGSLTYDTASGAPVATAPLGISRRQVDGSYLDATATVTASDGTWLVTGLPLGEYRATYAGDGVRRGSSHGFTVEYPRAETSLTGMQASYSIDTSAGDTTALVSGCLETDLGTDGAAWAAMAGAVLDIRRASDDTLVVQVTSDADGLWSTDLPEGSYVASYRANPDFLASDGFHHSMSSCESAFSVTTARVAVALIQGVGDYSFYAPATTAAATGTIAVSRDGYADIPMAGVALQVFQWDDATQDFTLPAGTATSDADGNWTIDLPAGEYVVGYPDDPAYLASDGHSYSLGAGDMWFIVSAAE